MQETYKGFDLVKTFEGWSVNETNGLTLAHSLTSRQKARDFVTNMIQKRADLTEAIAKVENEPAAVESTEQASQYPQGWESHDTSTEDVSPNAIVSDTRKPRGFKKMNRKARNRMARQSRRANR